MLKKNNDREFTLISHKSLYKLNYSISCEEFQINGKFTSPKFVLMRLKWGLLMGCMSFFNI